MNNDEETKNNDFLLKLKQNKKKYINKDTEFNKKYNNVETQEVFKKQPKIKQRKILSQLYGFQIDIVVMESYKNKRYILCIIDINTRK